MLYHPNNLRIHSRQMPHVLALKKLFSFRASVLHCRRVFTALHVHSSTPAVFCSAYIFHTMLPTSPLTAARILNFEQLPRAYDSKAVFGKGAPPVHEPQLLHIADLFLANRHPQSLSCLSREDSKRKTLLQQVGRNHNLPKLFRHAQEIRIHKPRIFKRFPLKHRRMTKSSTSAAAPTTKASASSRVSP